MAIYQYDGDAVLARKKDNIREPKQLKAERFCLQGGGSLVESAILEAEAEHKIKVRKVYFDSTIQARDAYFAGRCDAYVTDGTAAAGVRATVARIRRTRHLRIGHMAEPNGIVIARGDDKLFDIVRWTFNALIWAGPLASTPTMRRNARPREARKSDAFSAEAGSENPLVSTTNGCSTSSVKTAIMPRYGIGILAKDSPLKSRADSTHFGATGACTIPYPWD